MAYSDWVDDLTACAFGAVGHRVRRWHGTEMALLGDTEDDAVFEDPRAPFVQMCFVNLELEDGTDLHIGTYQNDTRFGLWPRLRTTSATDDAHAEGTFRPRVLHDAPAGRITAAECRLDAVDGDLVEILLAVDGRDVLVTAGEVEEARNDQIRIVWAGDSVLIFGMSPLAWWGLGPP